MTCSLWGTNATVIFYYDQLPLLQLRRVAAGLSPQIPGFDSRPKQVTLVADDFALEEVSIRELHFSVVSVTSPSFHICFKERTRGRRLETFEKKATLFRIPDKINRQLYSLFIYLLKHESRRTSRKISITYKNGIVRLEIARYFPQPSRLRWLWDPQNGTSGSSSCSKEHEADYSSNIEMRKRSNHKTHCFTDSKYFPGSCVQQHSFPHNLVNDLP